MESLHACIVVDQLDLAILLFWVHGFTHDPPRTREPVYCRITIVIQPIPHRKSGKIKYYCCLIFLAGFGSGVEPDPRLWRGLATSGETKYAGDRTNDRCNSYRVVGELLTA
jgi:hypothetical protein